jgi:polysaccharide biosynthesis protein PslG
MWYVSSESGTDLIYQAYGSDDFNFTRDPGNNIIALNTQGSPNDLVGQADLGGVFDQGFIGNDPARDAFLYFTGRNSSQLQFNGFRAVSPNPALVPIVPTPPPGQVTAPIIPTPAGPRPTPTAPIPGNPPPPPNGGPSSFQTPTPGDGNYPAFFNLWRRVDEPVKAGLVNRSWLFGPQPYGFRFLREQYEEGTRLVMYHDKARMESTPNGGVTNGLLVRELVSGELQVGDNKFEVRTQGNETVAGDPIELNILAPAYYSLRPVASINNDKRQGNKTGQPVFETLNRAGNVGQDFSKTGFNIRYVYYDGTLGHNIADVFWNYMQQGGLVLNPNGFATERIFDWVPVMGLPITEAYWTRAIVGGREIDVLVQAFERRVLTYTPSNPPGFQVEMGNVGRHYFRWRYGLSN